MSLFIALSLDSDLEPNGLQSSQLQPLPIVLHPLPGVFNLRTRLPDLRHGARVEGVDGHHGLLVGQRPVCLRTPVTGLCVTTHALLFDLAS